MLRASIPTELHCAVRAAAAYKRKLWPQILEEALAAWLAENKPRTLGSK